MYIELGKVVGVWGVKGWIKLHSYTRNRVDIADYSKWWFSDHKSSQKNSDNLMQIEVLNCREQGQGIVAQLAGINDRDHALSLNGYRIFVKETDLPALPDKQFYWHQLIGLKVSNVDEEIGFIDSIFETGANDVLVIKKPDTADVLIPYIDDVVLQVDLTQGTMLVDWDPAFLEN